MSNIPAPGPARARPQKEQGVPDRDFDRKTILPEPDLPKAAELIPRGRALASEVQVGRSAFAEYFGVACESDYKRQAAADGRIMLHAQIGYRDPAKSRRAWFEIHDAVARAGGRVDRYGICLDWSMGYPAAERAGRPRGTGLILEDQAAFAALTAEAPVAAHFGDFVIGTPAAVENTAAALRAGSTSIGNLGQYFTFRMPGWTDDVQTTAATVEAMALIAAQPVEVLVHSNLDDGFAALFVDLACTFGAVLIERYVVEDLIGAPLGHCFGNTFSDPLMRLAFQRALAKRPGAPGTMVYGATTLYDGAGHENYAALSSYLSVDALAQRLAPTGHAINPVPISEAVRIPDIDEVIDANVFALRVIADAEDLEPLIDIAKADRIAEDMITGGERFRDRVLAGLADAGLDTTDAFELLLAIRRIGPRRLEEAFGPGSAAPDQLRGRAPVVRSSAISALQRAAEKKIAALSASQRAAIADARLTVCLCATDVHEYGKILIGEMLRRLGVAVLDAGVHAEPDQVAGEVLEGGADLIAISTYNGVALDYLERLNAALRSVGVHAPVLIGGKLNQIPDQTNSSLPVDVSAELAAAGAMPCPRAEDLFAHLLGLAEDRPERASA